MASFHHSKVLAFESRRAKEIAELIRLNDGDAFVAPALVEVALEENQKALAFADQLYSNSFDMVILLTGVGTRFLGKVIASRDGEHRLAAELRKVNVVARGPKPSAVLREWQVPIHVQVPEPNTYRELLTAIEHVPGRRVAVQEYGRTNSDLLRGLEAQGRIVTTVPVYQWKLPNDTAPLAEALNRLLNGVFQVAIFTTGVQVEHFLDFASQSGKREQAQTALARLFLASIGPTCTESLRNCGLSPSMEPSHPKMGILVREAAEQFGARQQAAHQ